jgi:glycerol dehydrogenase-like iron-containing ADH family enzyme
MQKQQDQTLLTHLTTHTAQNQSNALIAMQSLKAAFKSYNLPNTNMRLPAEALDYHSLVKSQEKARQEGLNQMREIVEKHKERKEDALKAVEELMRECEQ